MSIKNQFPIFQKQPGLVFLDNASTTQKPESVLQRMDKFYREENSNIHRGLYTLAETASLNYEAVRKTVRDFLNARNASEIIFTHGATEALNGVVFGWAEPNLQEGDEVLLSLLEHHSNWVPWQILAKKKGIILKICPLTESGQIDMEAFEKLLNSKTKIVSITGMSNTLGTVTPLKKIIESAKKVGAKICVDAAQLVAHFPVDVQELDCDFLAFSSHKIYGPTGCGVLYAKAERMEEMQPWSGGGGMIREVHEEHSSWNDAPWKFEAGTPPIAEVLGMGAAIKWLSEIGWDFIKKHDRELFDYAVAGLETLPQVKILGPKNPQEHAAVISFVIDGIHAHDVASLLGSENICVRAGHHCTMPLMKNLGLAATSRLSFALYNEKSDIDRLVEGLEKLIQKFKLVQ